MENVPSTSRFYATQICSMVPSNLGTSGIFKAVQNNDTRFFTIAVCDTLLTPLSVVIVKNTSYLEKGTVSCQTETLYLNLDAKLLWTSQALGKLK